MERRLIIAAMSGIALVCAAVAIWFILTEPGRQRQKAEAARGGQVVAEGQARVGDKVSGATADLSDRQAARDQLGRETEDAISNHPAAGSAVDPDLHRLTLERLCLREANRAKPACVQLRQANPAAASR